MDKVCFARTTEAFERLELTQERTDDLMAQELVGFGVEAIDHMVERGERIVVAPELIECTSLADKRKGDSLTLVKLCIGAIAADDLVIDGDLVLSLGQQVLLLYQGLGGLFAPEHVV